MVEECEFHEEREDPAASSEENTAAYRDDPMKSLFGVGLADEGGNPPNVEVVYDEGKDVVEQTSPGALEVYLPEGGYCTRLQRFMNYPTVH